MTTVEHYRPTHIFPSDAPSNARRSYPISKSIAKIPPAVPSPPRLSRDSPPQKPQLRGEQIASFKMASSDSNQWLFTDEELRSTPSILHGIDPKLERQQRAKGTNFILQAAILLKIPQITIGVASTFLHRFYMRASMDSKKGYHHYTIAATALFLASKTEETCRKTKEIVIACTKVAQKNSNLMIDEQSTEYWRWRDNIMHHEEVLLEYLTFDLVLESPYHVLFAYLRELGVHKHEKLRNVAWAFINDGNHTTICLSLPSKDIAIAALYFAAQFIQDPLPDDDAGNPWWERLGGTVDKIVKGVKILSAFWRENPLMRQDNPYERSPIYSVEDLNRSRRSADIATPSPMHSQQMARNDSQMSNGAVNGTGEGSQNSRANGRMEKSISSNGVARVEERRDRKLGVQDESIVKAVESSAGTSDKALKEAANDPATHAPEALKQGVKRKEPSDSSDSSIKRVKTESDESRSVSQENANLEVLNGAPGESSTRRSKNHSSETTNGSEESTKAQVGSSSRRTQDHSSETLNGSESELPTKPAVEVGGDESEEGELEE